MIKLLNTFVPELVDFKIISARQWILFVYSCTFLIKIIVNDDDNFKLHFRTYANNIVLQFCRDRAIRRICFSINHKYFLVFYFCFNKRKELTNN